PTRRSSDLPGNAAVLRQNILECIAYKRVSSFLVLSKMLRYCAKRLAPIKIVGIDYGKWFIDHVLRAKHSMPGTPGFLAVGIPVFLRHQLVERLDHEFNFYLALQTRQEYVFHRLLDFIPNDEHHLGKACPDRIVKRIIHNRFAVRAEAIDLFNAPITAAYPRGEYEQS